MRKDREVLTLQCNLTEEELREKSIEHVHVLNEVDQLTDDLKSMQKRMKAAIEENLAKEGTLRVIIDTGRDFRKVECSIIYDWEAKKKHWIRLDTNVTAKIEPISEHELQEEMKLREAEGEEPSLLNEEGVSPVAQDGEINPHDEPYNEGGFEYNEDEPETQADESDNADVQENEELPAD